MSVAKHGVKGYEYQYKVTVLISLLPNIEKIELYVETEGSEDAILKIKHNNIYKTIEIQVKRENQALDLVKIIDWLCHFQKNKTDNNLLSRISENEDNIALFVTQSRCSDEIVRLKTKILNINPHPDVKISKKWETQFFSYLSNKSFGKSNLMQGRESFCKYQSKYIKSKAKLISILHQILIWEEISDNNIDNEVKRILNTNCSIALSNTNQVYQKLIEIIKKGRDTGENILPELQIAIQENKADRPTISKNHQLRKEEKRLLNLLIEGNTLLLTGLSLCGKTEMAKKLSSYFFDNGYDYILTADVDSAIRFFSSNPINNKVAILEDPWGHSDLLSDFDERRELVSKILSNLPSHHKLIITSRLEILSAAFETIVLKECKINNINWTDLTIRDNSTINAFWNKFSNSTGLPRDISDLVSRNILSSPPENLLQIGQLNYLANEEINDLRNKTYTEIEHIARRNSKEIANSIKRKNEYYATVFSVLGICATPIHNVRFIDLAYILTDDSERSSFIDKSFFSSSFGSNDPKFPEYSNEYRLSDKTVEAITFLEERQLISVLENEVKFSHPNYYEAARHLFFSRGELKQKMFLKRFEKCIFCLNPTTAYLSTIQYSFIFNSIINPLKSEIIRLAFDSLNSIFPAVEDNSLIFLVNQIGTLERGKTQSIIHMVQNGGTRDENIYWHNGKIPFISNEGGIGNWLVEVDGQIVAEVEQNLRNNRLPEVSKGWIFIESLKDGRNVDMIWFKILFQYNESFVRQKLVYQVFNRLVDTHNDLIQEIFSDEHPSVVFNAIRASFINWFNYSQELKSFLFDLIKESLKKLQVSIRTYNLISTFSIDYSHEGIFTFRDLDEQQKKELWNLWGILFQITLDRVPIGVFTNTARFGSTMNDAIKYMDKNVGISVFESWYKRIEYQIQNHLVLDEFELAIAADLMEFTGSDYKSRKDLFTNLISSPDTSFILSTLKWIIGFWNELDSSEREQLIDLPKTARIDSRWIKAVFLTSYSPPNEVVEQILGESQVFTMEFEKILSIIPTSILLDCLHVYCGFPQPLYWLALHNKNTKFWGFVIRKILMDETHPAWEMCLYEFLDDGVNGFSENWRDGMDLWKEICAKTLVKRGLTETLIYTTAICTCNITQTKMLWSILQQSYISTNNEEEIIEIIVDNIEMLQQTGQKEDLFEIIEKELLYDKIIPKLFPDIILLETLNAFRTNPLFKEEEKIDIMSKILEITNSSTIRFFGTFNFIENLNKDEKIPEIIREQVRTLPNMIKVIGKEKVDERNQRYEYKLDDWVGIN